MNIDNIDHCGMVTKYISRSCSLGSLNLVYQIHKSTSASTKNFITFMGVNLLEFLRA